MDKQEALDTYMEATAALGRLSRMIPNSDGIIKERLIQKRQGIEKIAHYAGRQLRRHGVPDTMVIL